MATAEAEAAAARASLESALDGYNSTYATFLEALGDAEEISDLPKNEQEAATALEETANTAYDTYMNFTEGLFDAE